METVLLFFGTNGFHYQAQRLKLELNYFFDYLPLLVRILATIKGIPETDFTTKTYIITRKYHTLLLCFYFYRLTYQKVHWLFFFRLSD